MRHTDDLADEPGAAAEQARRARRWRATVARRRSRGAADGWPGWPALADTVARHAIPRDYLDEVIDGVAMDLEPRTFATFDDLYGYCYRVASAVGLCCLHIWGFRSEGGRAESLAEACGVALQLTNILRDVREDAGNGRVYLPHDDLERFGVAADGSLGRRRRASRLRACSHSRRAGPTITTSRPGRSPASSRRSAGRSCGRSSGSIGRCSTRSSGAITTSWPIASRFPPGGRRRSRRVAGGPVRPITESCRAEAPRC